MNRIILAFVALCILSLACGSSVTTVSDRCVTPGEEQISFIRGAVRDIQSGNDIQSIWSVKSNDFENVWMIAAEISGTGIKSKEAIGVWAMNGDIHNPTIVYAVNHIAEGFSGFRLASDAGLNLDMTSDGAQEALSCAQGK